MHERLRRSCGVCGSPEAVLKAFQLTIFLHFLGYWLAVRPNSCFFEAKFLFFWTIMDYNFYLLGG